MNLLIDIGNTLVKIAVCHNNEILFSQTELNPNLNILRKILKEYPEIRHCIISSVSDQFNELKTFLKNQNIHVLTIDETTKLPFISKYLTRNTLGKDRIAGIAGAVTLFPGRDVLVIDAGTAITFDLKNKYEEYLGGNISPGLDMRFRALNHFTTNLPLLNSAETDSIIGVTTSQAIINGVQRGLIFETEGYIDAFLKTYAELIVVITGGNAQFFDNKLKKTIFVVSNLILIGLNTILEKNVQTK